ncbi:hypothetical protein DPMN_159227 [Dreissena polymorpha]|uniref:Uncharacterized protein n=1 Tax=Dreissena polymorpha TaxID=45954 RepID=A0A9D4INZ9_DREPO|nr:hypothetical protein DPMN_159227 [Dreissena polymorpha]
MEGDITLTTKLHQMFLLMLVKETIPLEIKDASIIHLYEQKETNRPTTTTEAYFCSPLKGKSLQGSCLIALLLTLKNDSYLKVSVGSAGNEGPMTWCSLQDSFKKSVRNKTLICSPSMST